VYVFFEADKISVIHRKHEQGIDDSLEILFSFFWELKLNFDRQASTILSIDFGITEVKLFNTFDKQKCDNFSNTLTGWKVDSFVPTARIVVTDHTDEAAKSDSTKDDVEVENKMRSSWKPEVKKRLKASDKHTIVLSNRRGMAVSHEEQIVEGNASENETPPKLQSHVPL